MRLRTQRVLLALITRAETAKTALFSTRVLFLGCVGLVSYGVSFWSVGAALVTGGGLLILDLKT